jgi:hypothetical protein
MKKAFENGSCCCAGQVSLAPGGHGAKSKGREPDQEQAHSTLHACVSGRAQAGPKQAPGPGSCQLARCTAGPNNRPSSTRAKARARPAAEEDLGGPGLFIKVLFIEWPHRTVYLPRPIDVGTGVGTSFVKSLAVGVSHSHQSCRPMGLLGAERTSYAPVRRVGLQLSRFCRAVSPLGSCQLSLLWCGWFSDRLLARSHQSLSVFSASFSLTLSFSLSFCCTLKHSAQD